MKMERTVSDVAASMLFASDEHSSYFKINGPEHASEVMDIPNNIMHRFFRLGQAYNLKKLRYLEPESMFVIGHSEVQEFIKDITKLLKIINDEELHGYINKLLGALDHGGTSLNKNIAIKTDSYYEKRRT